jgi:hypothetical protein
LEAALFNLDKQVARGFALMASANLRKAEQQKFDFTAELLLQPGSRI